jgi:hypothetical protein
MPLIQGGPPEWIWERTANLLKWEVLPAKGSNGQQHYELRVNCGLEILRWQFFTEDGIKELRAVIDEALNAALDEQKTEPVQTEPEPGVSPEPEPGNLPETPEADRPPQRAERVPSEPHFAG